MALGVDRGRLFPGAASRSDHHDGRQTSSRGAIVGKNREEEERGNQRASCLGYRNRSHRAQRRAGLPRASGAVHLLRHTFCSHLAMRGAPAKAIQELTGHAHLSTTLRYLHLSPAARTSAIEPLQRAPARGLPRSHESLTFRALA